MASESLIVMIRLEVIPVGENHDDSTDIENDDQDEIPCSMNKKRKIEIEHEKYTWEIFLKKFEQSQSNLSTKLCLVRILEKMVEFNCKIIPNHFLKQIIDIINRDHLISIDSKPNNLTDHQIKLEFVNKSILGLFFQIFKEAKPSDKWEILPDKIDLSKLVNHCLTNCSHHELIRHTISLDNNLIKIVVNRILLINDHLDLNNLHLISESNLECLEFNLRLKFIEKLMYLTDISLKSNKNQINYAFVSKIILKLIEVDLNESINDFDFLLGNISENIHENLLRNKIQVKVKKYSNLPNVKLLNNVVENLVQRVKIIAEQTNIHLILSDFLMNSNILSNLDQFVFLNQGIEFLKTETKSLFLILIDLFNQEEDLEVQITVIKEIYTNLKLTLNKPKFFNLASGPKLIETCLKILESKVENKTKKDLLNQSQNPYLNNDLTKLDYLKLISFGLLLKISIDFHNIPSLKQVGSSLKLKLFKYVNSNKTSLKHEFLVLFLANFQNNDNNVLELKEFDYCLKLFDLLFSTMDTLRPDLAIYLLDIYHNYSFRLLSSNSFMIYTSNFNNSDLNRCQDNYIRLIDNYFNNDEDDEPKLNSNDFQISIAKLFAKKSS